MIDIDLSMILVQLASKECPLSKEWRIQFQREVVCSVNGFAFKRYFIWR